MQTEISKIVSDINTIQQAQQIKKIEDTIKKHLGQNFIKQHIKTIYSNKEKFIIETKSIEAKTELNLLRLFGNKNIKIK
tara:strand:+ start:460 stop:696 length:237 start_codon:yes stop_codon:yes gene_type:complete